MNDWRRVGAALIDGALEASVVGSFTTVGPTLRRRLDHWQDPPAVAGRRIVITGASSGLGLAAALALADLGAELVLIGRNAEKLAQAHAEVQARATLPVVALRCDLADLAAVRHLSDEIAAEGPVDVLVHNAGALVHEYQRTAAGHELTFTVHVLAPLLLTELLVPSLAAAAPSRVLFMTSGGLYTQRFALDQVELGPEGFDGSVAYARAKRAQVVLTTALNDQLGPLGISVHLCHPGWANTPGVDDALPRFAKVLGPTLRTPAEGADTLVWLAGQPGGEPTPAGQLWLDRRPRGVHHLAFTRKSAAEERTDAEQLLRRCQEAIGLTAPPTTATPPSA